MKVTQSKQPNGTVHIKATASVQDVQNALNYTYNEIAKFFGIEPDPNKTFEQALEEKTGTASNVDEMVLPRAIEKLIPIAIDCSGLRPAFLPTGRPLSPLRMGKEFSFEFTATPKPLMTLSSCDDIKIAVVEPMVFEEDIQAEMEKYRDTVASFEDEDKEEKLRMLVIDKLEFQRQRSFDAQLRQQASIELAKRLEGEIPDEILQHMFMDLKESMEAQIKAQGKDLKVFLEEHEGEDNVAMMLMWQARETLRQGYALDAYFRAKKLKITEKDIDATFAEISGATQLKTAKKLAREMGRMYTVYETAERFKAADHILQHAQVEIRPMTELERDPGASEQL